MSDYVLSCCSTVDLNLEHLEHREIAYIYFNYHIDGVAYKDDFGATHAPADLYRLMLNGADVKTSQVATGDYVEHFTRFLAAGKDVLHVTLSSGVSGTYASACMAAEIVRKQFPERTVRIVDSLAVSSGYGLLVDKLADLRDEGMGINEAADWAEANRSRIDQWILSTDLTFLVRGGRLSKAAGVMGGMLKICPLLKIDAEGKLTVSEKIRTKTRALARLTELMCERAEGGLAYNQKCFISNGECLNDAHDLAARIEETFAQVNGEVGIFSIGATIGCHTGPGTLTLFYWNSDEQAVTAAE